MGTGPSCGPVFLPTGSRYIAGGMDAGSDVFTLPRSHYEETGSDALKNCVDTLKSRPAATSFE